MSDTFVADICIQRIAIMNAMISAINNAKNAKTINTVYILLNSQIVR